MGNNFPEPPRSDFYYFTLNFKISKLGYLGGPKVGAFMRFPIKKKFNSEIFLRLYDQITSENATVSHRFEWF